MDIKELLKTINDNLKEVAKSLVDGKNDEAVDLLTKSAETLGEAITKSEEPSGDETPNAEETPEATKEEPAQEGEAIEKSTPLTKAQQTTLAKFADAIGELNDAQMTNLVKWVEMYISASDVPDFVAQFEAISTRLEKMEKSSKQAPEHADDAPQRKGETLSKSMFSAMQK